MQVEEATLPGSQSDEKPLRQSARTRSSKSKVVVKDEELAEEEPQENGDVTENQLQVNITVTALMCKQAYLTLVFFCAV